MKFINICINCYKWYWFYVFWFCERGYESSKNCSASYGTHGVQKFKQITQKSFQNKQKTTFTNIKNYFSFFEQTYVFFVFFQVFFYFFLVVYNCIFFIKFVVIFCWPIASLFFCHTPLQTPCVQEIRTNLSDSLRNRKTAQCFV